MIKIIKCISDLDFSGLMSIYIEGNRLNGQILYRDESEGVQVRKAEEDFYNYLNSIFFRQYDSFYAVWITEDRYRAALRIEPYSDGYLLCALETAPEDRRKGYAALLITETLHYLSLEGSGIVYSHVSKKNMPSMSLHRKCGFYECKDYAVYADGSVLHDHVTFAIQYEKVGI